MGRDAYRWLVLLLSFLVNATIQVLWVTYASVTLEAQQFYGVGTTAIGAFSMIFMVAFIPLSLPASWLIDRVGIRTAVGTASVLVGVGGVLRGLAGDSYGLALAATTLPAVAQPVLLNSWTATVHPWFAEGKRTTAVSVITLGNLIGTAVGLVLTPALAPSLRLDVVQLWYGIAALLAGVAFAVFMRDRPAALGGEFHVVDEELGYAIRESLRLMVRPPMPILLAIALAAFGTFNGVTTWIEPIVEPKGLNADDAGLFGALMLLGGLVGAVVVAEVCDRTGRRSTALVACLTGAAVSLLAVALTTTRPAQFVSATVLGFFLVSCLPVAIEYATELARPTSPAIANGLVQLFGQASVVLVLATGAAGERIGTFLPTLYVGAAFLLLGAAGAALVSRAGGTAQTAAADPSTRSAAGADADPRTGRGAHRA